MSKNSVIENIYPLAPMQEGMLFHALYAPGSGLYVVQLSNLLSGEVNVLAFRQAWQQVIDINSVLRTAFIADRGSKPFQVVYRRATCNWEELDWRCKSDTEQQAALEFYLAADRRRGFVLSQPPLTRVTLIRLADNAYHF